MLPNSSRFCIKSAATVSPTNPSPPCSTNQSLPMTTPRQYGPIRGDKFHSKNFVSVGDDGSDITADHLKTHSALIEKLAETEKPIIPHLWQSCVAHELISGKDVILKAGTGSGKSLVFQAVSLLNACGITIVVSPLNALMADQVNRCVALGIRACSLNAETVSADPELVEDIRNGRYQLINVAAEFTDINGNAKWKSIMGKTGGKTPFTEGVSLIVVDEAHLIRDWRRFRPFYRNLDVLRAKWSKVPILACSGTMPPHVLDYIWVTLKMRRLTCFCDLESDRPSITLISAPLKSGTVTSMSPLEYVIPQALRNLAEGEYFDVQTIPKTIIFIDNKLLCANLAGQLISLCPVWARKSVDGPACRLIREYHSALSSEGKERNMTDFRLGITRIFICTDAVGMGVDIPDVDRVIQWKIPEYLSISGLWQRIGRAARDAGRCGIGIVFFEPSLRSLGVLQGQISIDAERKEVVDTYLIKDISRHKDDADVESTPQQMSKQTPADKREQHLLWLLNTKGCRRAVAMDYLGSPVLPRVTPCCDACMRKDDFDTGDFPDFPLMQSTAYIDNPQVEIKVEDVQVASTQQAEAEDGEQEEAKATKTRKTQYDMANLKRLRLALTVGLKTYRAMFLAEMPPGPFSAKHILPDEWILKISEKQDTIQTTDDLKAVINGSVDVFTYSILGKYDGGTQLLNFIGYIRRQSKMEDLKQIRIPGQPYTMPGLNPLFPESDVHIEPNLDVKDAMRNANTKLADFDIDIRNQLEQRRVKVAESIRTRTSVAGSSRAPSTALESHQDGRTIQSRGFSIQPNEMLNRFLASNDSRTRTRATQQALMTQEAITPASTTSTPAITRKPLGRPRGSKNKPKTVIPHTPTKTAITEESPVPPKRKVGRPRKIKEPPPVSGTPSSAQPPMLLSFTSEASTLVPATQLPSAPSAAKKEQGGQAKKGKEKEDSE